MKKNLDAASGAPVRAHRVGIIVLAAGSSSRLGEPKQLLQYQGETLLRRAVRLATESGCSPVIVVLGSEYERLWQEARYGDARPVVNPDWADGMGRSIAVGLETALAVEPELDGVVITLCDQPLVTSEHLLALVAGIGSSNYSVVATGYDGKRGVPACFTAARFAELLALHGTVGANKIIAARETELTSVPFPAALHDVDTPEDYHRLFMPPLKVLTAG